MKRGIFSAHTPFSFATMAKAPFCTLPLSLGKLSLTPWPPIFSIERRDRMVSRAARSASALVDFEMSAPTGTDGHMMSLLSCTGRQICFGSAPRSHCDLPLQDTIPAFDRFAGKRISFPLFSCHVSRTSSPSGESLNYLAPAYAHCQ